MFPDVIRHLPCFCWEGGFLGALDLLRMVVWSKNCVLNVKVKMFPPSPETRRASQTLRLALPMARASFSMATHFASETNFCNGD